MDEYPIHRNGTNESKDGKYCACSTAVGRCWDGNETRGNLCTYGVCKKY